MRRGMGVGLPMLAALGLVISCSSENESESDSAPVLTAATLGAQSVAGVAEYLATPPYATADRDNGERQAALCRACHTLDADGRHMIGPNLHGFFGQPAGARSGFAYSAALGSAEFTWTPRALDAWLAEPARFLPGNRMSFAGVRDAQDRADLIAYLLEATTTE